jgi:hypothetical protein
MFAFVRRSRLPPSTKTETRNGCTNPGSEEATIGNQPESLRLSVSILTEGCRLFFGTTSESWEPRSTNDLCWPHRSIKILRDKPGRTVAKLRPICVGPLAASIQSLVFAANCTVDYSQNGTQPYWDCLTCALGLAIDLENASLKAHGR